jgi:shikimate kinase
MYPETPTSIRAARIVLIGFMGAGKSTVGPIVAGRLGWRFVDADQYLKEKTGASIAGLFSSLGEAGFRSLEAEAFDELHQQQALVLALGGGAMETESIRSALSHSKDSHVVFLKASFDTLLERCDRQSASVVRPLLQQRETLIDRFQSRLRHYEQAHATVVTEGLDPDAVADRILSGLATDPPLSQSIPKVIAT